MTKILEVLMAADGEITFDTDIDITKGVKIIPDMAVSINREQMIDQLREEAQTLCQCIEDSKREMMSRGIKVYTFSPQSPKANKS